MAEDMSRRMRNELTRLYTGINETVNRAAVTSGDIQYFINILEHVHHHLLRFSQSGFVATHCVRILQNVLTRIREDEMAELGFASSVPGVQLYRETPLGRPRYFLSREQLEFLLSLGFNKTQLSRMLGISARTIQRRIAEFGLSIRHYSDAS